MRGLFFLFRASLTPLGMSLPGMCVLHEERSSALEFVTDLEIDEDSLNVIKGPKTAGCVIILNINQ